MYLSIVEQSEKVYGRGGRRQCWFRIEVGGYKFWGFGAGAHAGMMAEVPEDGTAYLGRHSFTARGADSELRRELA